MVTFEFEWDARKEKSNVRKHGVTFLEAMETFSDPKGFQMVDVKHSESEPRLYRIGRTKSGRILTTWFTQRGIKVRIIGSAEWRKFRRFYYETTEIE